MNIEELSALLPGVREADRSTETVADVEHDSRRVSDGALFACIEGASSDGHDHAPAAVEAGAVALLVQRPLGLGVPEILVSSVREAVGPAASAVHGRPSSSIPVIGVTGTNGKTTTVRLVADVLSSLGHRVTEIGTLTGARTTPEAPELQRQLAQAVRTGADVVAMEVSSHALDQHRVDGTRFAVAAFTNLGVDHLDHHGDLATYEAAKARLFTPELAEFAVISTDTPAGRRIADATTLPLVEVDGSVAADATVEPDGSRFVWRGLNVELPLSGAFNVTNAIIAAEIVAGLGYPNEDIARALGEVRGAPGRFEIIDEGQAFATVVDYAHTPDGLEAVLSTARRVTDGRLTVVFGAGGDRDASKRPRMGEVARRLADTVVVTSDNPRNEDPEAIIASIVAGMDGAPNLVEPDRRLAIRHALAVAREGDLVLIAGKGHETTQTIGGEVLEFDDREVARAELRQLGDRSS